jgi:hypothetical protein
MGVLCLPNIQYVFKLVEEEPLGGAFIKPGAPYFTKQFWFWGSYQEAFNKAYNASFGFHNTLIRLRNQFYYSVLHASAEPDFVRDKNDYIHSRNNIRSVTGDDFKGELFFEERMRKLKVVSDSLKAHGIPLLFVLAPGRSNILRDQLLPRYHPADSTATNYYWLNNKIQKYGIDNINFHQYFIEIKDTIKYPLFYKNGVHWSLVSFSHAFDSIVKKLATYQTTALTKFTPAVSTMITDSSNIQDEDQIPGMNLFSYKKDQQFYYPLWRVDSVTYPLPKLLCIGDSYFLTFLYQHMADSIFDYQYWFYHNTVYPQSFTKETNIRDIDYWDVVFKSNYILIVSSEVSWDLGGFDFVENAYNYFSDKEGTILKQNMDLVKKKIINMNNYINNTPDYLQAEIEKANQNKITIAEMTWRDAFYLVELDYKQKLNDETAFQTFYESYKNSKTVNNYINTMPVELKTNSNGVIRILAYKMALQGKTAAIN